MRRFFRDEQSIGLDDFRRQETESDGRALVSHFRSSLAIDENSDGLFAGRHKLRRYGGAAAKNEILLR